MIRALSLRQIFATRSIRFRLASIFVAIFGTTLVLFSVLLFQAFSRSSQADFDAALFNHAVDVSRAVDIDFFGDLSVQMDQMATGSKIFPFSLGRSFVQIRGPEGTVLGKSRNLGSAELPFSGQDARELGARGAVFRTLGSGSVPLGRDAQASSYRMIDYLVARPQLPRLVLQIAVPTTLIDRERGGLLTFLFINIPLTLVVAMLGGIYLSRRALAPVSAIMEKAARIGASDLSERLPVPPVEDELQGLAVSLNGLLDRLQKSFEGQERFIADASHQLRTPLSILRGEIDLMRSRDRSPEEVREFLVSSSQEIDHLSKLVADLLVLARVDSGQGALEIHELRLDEILMEVVARLESTASARKVRLRFNIAPGASSFEVKGDPDLVRSLLHNLVENAIKYSPQEGEVHVELSEEERQCLVQVQDQGPGIPPGDLERIFDRFFRLESTRDKASGAGLGLAIARRIAEAHHATLEAANAPFGGAVFRLRMNKL